MEMNSMLVTDFYKIGHPNQYHPNINLVYSNGTARKSRVEGVNYTVVAGVQSFIKEFLIDHFNRNFFNKTEEQVINEYSRRVRTSLGSDPEPLKHKFYLENFPNDPYGHIRHLHRLGRIPLKIKVLPEGSICPIKVPFVTLQNDKKKHPELFWLTNFVESIMSASTWQMITSATLAHEYRKLFNKYAMETVGNTDFVQFQGHDFSFRGMSSLQTACYSGAGHLFSFVGTDTIPAIDFLEQYYNANSDKEMVGVSVAATEHAVMCSNTGFYVWDKAEGDWSRVGDCEFEVFKNLITVVYPKGIVSIVSDTWDLWRVLLEYARRLKAEILAREGKVVFRPDSGDPANILCGYQNVYSTFAEYSEYQVAQDLTPNEAEYKGVVELLWDIFEGTTTPMGYKLLDSHVGCTYGDSISLKRADDICNRLKMKGFASINWVAGIGSYTYQYNTRDTFGMAIKATYCEAMSTDGTKYFEIPIFKDPITDDGTKKSARGLLRVDEVPVEGGKTTFVLRDNVSWEEEAGGALVTVFDDGVLVKEYSLQEIRDRLSTDL
jgi:nicotinamide phosphoribosyltransferase